MAKEEMNLKTDVTVTHRLEISENAFWLVLWSIVATGIVVLVAILGSNSLESDRILAKSSDPVATACATGLGSHITNQCTVLLARKN